MADRFVTDGSIELVARRLRMLGFDVARIAGADLDAVFAAARSEDRIVLTPSARHPRRFAAVPVFRVPRDPRAAIRAVVARYAPSSPPFARCSVCNTPLETRAAAGAPDAVPERVRRERDTIEHCATCGRWYWQGSHVARMRAWLAEIGSP